MIYAPHIQPISFGSPLYDASIALRYEVLRAPLGREFSVRQLEEEWRQTHIGYSDPATGQLSGVLVLRHLEDGKIRMRQVAVDPGCQRRGIGQALVHYAERFAQQLRYEQILLHARMPAVAFYRKLGYVAYGPDFAEVGIPHKAMRKSLG